MPFSECPTPLQGSEPASLNRWTRSDAAAGLGLFLASILFSGSLWLGGAWFVSHEMLHPLVRLLEFDFALRGGQFPVRWCDNLAAGYGYPFFNFYAPLSFALAEFFHLVGFGLAGAWKAETILVVWLGGAGMYGLLRPLAGRLGATVAAMLYLFAPYHAVTLYVRGNLAELTALSAWPWAFWGMRAIVHALPRWKTSPAIPLAAVAIAAVALSHVLTAYMAVLSLVAFGLILAFTRRGPRPGASELRTETDPLLPVEGDPRSPIEKDLPSVPSTDERSASGDAAGEESSTRSSPVAVLSALSAVAVLSAALALFFWLPALVDLRYCAHALLYEHIDFKNHYVLPLQFFDPSWGYGESVPGRGDTISFQLGLALWIGVAAAAWTAFRSRHRSIRALTVFSLALLFLHLSLMTGLSRAVWEVLPGAGFLQFPWRLLIPATFWASVAGGLAAGEWARGAQFHRRSRRLFAVLLLAMPPALAAPYLHPLFFYPEVPNYDPAVLRRIMTTTTAGEYIPVWVDQIPPTPSRRQIGFLSATGESRFLDSASASYLFELAIDRPGLVLLDVFYFPGWSTRIDSTPVDTFPVTPQGLIGWNAPAGRHEVRVEFRDTPLRRSANLVSLVSVLLIAAWLLLLATQRLRKAPAS